MHGAARAWQAFGRLPPAVGALGPPAALCGQRRVCSAPGRPRKPARHPARAVGRGLGQRPRAPGTAPWPPLRLGGRPGGQGCRRRSACRTRPRQHRASHKPWRGAGEAAAEEAQCPGKHLAGGSAGSPAGRGLGARLRGACRAPPGRERSRLGARRVGDGAPWHRRSPGGRAVGRPRERSGRRWPVAPGRAPASGCAARRPAAPPGWRCRGALAARAPHGAPRPTGRAPRGLSAGATRPLVAAPLAAAGLVGHAALQPRVPRAAPPGPGGPLRRRHRALHAVRAGTRPGRGAASGAPPPHEAAGGGAQCSLPAQPPPLNEEHRAAGDAGEARAGVPARRRRGGLRRAPLRRSAATRLPRQRRAAAAAGQRARPQPRAAAAAAALPRTGGARRHGARLCGARGPAAREAAALFLHREPAGAAAQPRHRQRARARLRNSAADARPEAPGDGPHEAGVRPPTWATRGPPALWGDLLHRFQDRGPRGRRARLRPPEALWADRPHRPGDLPGEGHERRERSGPARVRHGEVRR
mmetsp:Transcript_10094/g.32076  ORF Transcript_10094/g.32076 Transcript_10094/m.32076 type:complete len:528 (+) Transcript_10094:10-1593(+)